MLHFKNLLKSDCMIFLGVAIFIYFIEDPVDNEDKVYSELICEVIQLLTREHLCRI